MTKYVFLADPVGYQPHLIHTRERDWAETNCYVDVLIELLHGWGFEPIAALPFTIAIDFEGDQWTFFKFPDADLRELYGLDIQELAVWRPLVAHIEEQVGLGRPVLVELDSYYLPDTAGTAYQREHVKSTVAIIDIDVAGQRVGYYHGQGFYHLSGDDFEKVFRITGPNGPETLPEVNPFEKFQVRFAADLDWLAQAPLEVFHQYSFATLRQFGACYELAATYIQWLQAHDIAGLEEPAVAFAKLSSTAKSMQFQLARAMMRKKPLDLAPVHEMANVWNAAMDHLKLRLL